MNLLPERSFVYRLPIDASALGIVAEYETAKTSDTERAESLRSQLPRVTEQRITVRTISVLRQGQYERYRDEARRVVDEATGGQAQYLLENYIHQAQSGDVKLMIAAFNTASMLASLVKIEQRTFAYDADPPAWEQVEVPAEWRTVAGFLDTMQASNRSLFDVWCEAANEVNPDLWVIRTDAEAKKFGAVT